MANQVQQTWSFLEKKHVQVCCLYPDDGFLCLKEDPELWIRSNPADRLSVRRLELNIEWHGGVEKLGDSIVQLSELTHLCISYGFSLKCLPNTLSSLPNLQVLNLYHCDNLEQLPANLGDLQSLTRLVLKYCNSIQYLPSSLAKLSKLTTLQLHSCDSLTELPPNLDVVDLSLSCRIQSLPNSLCSLKSLDLPLCICFKECLQTLKSLRHFTIRGCYEHPHNIQELLVNLKELINLQTLVVHRSLTINSLPTFPQLHNLQKLYLQCPIEELPTNVDELPEVLLLDIQHTCIQCLPWTITRLPKLRFLCLPWNFRLQTLPYHLVNSIVISVEEQHVRKTWKEIKQDLGLQLGVSSSDYFRVNGDVRTLVHNNYDLRLMAPSLDLEDIDMAEITDILVGKLTKLTNLYISNCINFKRFLNSITIITHLSLSECDIKSLSDGLEKLSSLVSLDLDLGDTEFSECINLPVMYSVPYRITKLSNLTTLSLYSCWALQSLPPNLNLTKLKLTDSSIKSLPTGLKHLEIIQDTENIECSEEICCDELEKWLNQVLNLETLSVICYGIECLPSIARLCNLRILQLKDCFRLKQLPPDLDELVNLCILDVSGTRIKSFPHTLTNLPNLQHVILPKCFEQGSLPPKFHNKSIVSIDDTDEKYYEDREYYDSKYETSTLGSVERVDEEFLEESEEDIIAEQQAYPYQLFNLPDAPADSNVNGRNDLIGENSHQASHNPHYQEMDILSSRIPSQRSTMSFENEHEITVLDHHIPSCDERSFDHSWSNPHTLENKQNDNNSQMIAENMTQVDAGKEAGDSHFTGRIDPIGNESQHPFCSLQNQGKVILPNGDGDWIVPFADESLSSFNGIFGHIFSRNERQVHDEDSHYNRRIGVIGEKSNQELCNLQMLPPRIKDCAVTSVIDLCTESV